MEKEKRAGERFSELVRIVAALRSEKGCPWDREQDEKSIMNYLLEESYEAVEAITSGDEKSLAEELGDILLEVVLLSRIYEEKNAFSLLDVLERIIQKMISRHPHVFGQEDLRTARRVYEEWQKKKRLEKRREGFFDGFANTFPALFEAFQIGQRVSQFGFDWQGPADAFQKVKEELEELEEVLQKKKTTAIIHEIGDIFFALANVSRLLGVNPELALKKSNGKFIKRFHYMEKKLREKGIELGQASLEEMDEIWEESKNIIY